MNTTIPYGKGNITLQIPEENLQDIIRAKEDNKSKSDNSPFLGTELKGKVLAVLNNGKIFKNGKKLFVSYL